MASPHPARFPFFRWLLMLVVIGSLGMLLSGRLSLLSTLIGSGNPPELSAAASALAKGDLAKADAQFDAAIRAHPTDPAVYLTISQVCKTQKRFDLAARYVERGLLPCKDAPRPVRALLYVDLSSSYSEIEKTHPQKQALFAAQRAVELDPTNPYNLNAYGYLLAENDTQLDEAVAQLTLALQLLKKLPDSTEARLQISMTEDSYGWALYKQGKYEPAATALYQAINDFPSDPEVTQEIRAESLKVLYYHLGAAYFKSNRLSDARSALQTSLSYDKDYKEAQEELKLLDAAAPASGPPTGASTAPPPSEGPEKHP